MITRASRSWALALPAILAAAAGLAQQGCNRQEADVRPLVSDGKASSHEQKLAEADRRLANDVAFVSAATVRCSQPSATASCVREAAADIAKLRPQGLRTQGLDQILSQLPVKETICAIVRGLTTHDSPSGDAEGKADGGSPSPDGGAADAGTATRIDPSLYAAGGPIAGAPAGTVADEVWDLAHGQVAVFVHPKGGVGALARIAGPYSALAGGTHAGVIDAWSGSFVLATDGMHVQSASGLTATVLAADSGPQYLPAFGGMSLPAMPVYTAWDAATEKLAQSLAALQPKLAGDKGAEYIQLDSLPGMPTTNEVAPIVTAMLVNAGDQGDFESPAGKPALAGIAKNVADQLGIGIDAWCGPAPTSTDGTDSNLAGSSTCAPYTGDTRCGSGNTCSWNGSGFCCRPEPTATVEEEGCSSDTSCQTRHGESWVCSNNRDDKFVCAPKAACK